MQDGEEEEGRRMKETKERLNFFFWLVRMDRERQKGLSNTKKENLPRVSKAGCRKHLYSF